ncbi:MAG: pentapeptide repeat-containing protein [Alphaproteobacteria bacterium]|nr:pentapeptide repeat-containing protein [Alphaproteobacteria bacterium]
MKKTYIKNHKNKGIIFEGTFPNQRAALEAAVRDHVSLAYADLRGARLNNANLDGADLRFAQLENASLVGANLSETDFTGASLGNADCSLACLCECRLQDADCTDTVFAGTLVGGSTIDNTIFTALSAFALPFAGINAGRNILHHDGRVYTFTGAPVVISGLPKRIALLDNAVIIGNTAYARGGFSSSWLAELQRLCVA